MCLQYGNFFTDMRLRVGSWEKVGRKIASTIREQENAKKLESLGLSYKKTVLGPVAVPELHELPDLPGRVLN